MKIWKVILATLVIFSAGVLAGARLTQMRHWRMMRDEDRGRFPVFGNQSAAARTNRGFGLPGARPPFRNMGKEFLERLDRELELKPEQRKQIEDILTESQKRAREIWKQVEPQMHEEMSQSRAEIRAVLDPAQAAKFEELMKRATHISREGQTNGAWSGGAPPPSNHEAAP